ncbi:3-hydroxyacyl-ACP dehydratase [uncultured Arcticibacterium sp.]|uniref:3-hydroxyacyl-ACP dehydratase n=1 Tax=uncultured Arcticibacterium sp. TaxID=2173042 RepID=UPI0030F67163
METTIINFLPSEPILSGEQVSKLIPQKPPIEMVDSLWYNDETKTVSGFHIKTDNIFVENGFFTEPGLIENIAQTAALRVGYIVSEKNKSGDNVKPPIGFIGGIKKLSIEELPAVNENLLTHVEIVNVVFGVNIIEGKVFLKDKCIASCEMKIFLKEE